MSRVKRYENSELMKLAGSKSGAYDPESPAQWRYVLDHGTPEEQTVAWVKSKTTHMSRSPYCVSERGTALWIQHLAADRGWTQKTARNVLNAVAKQGRIRLDLEAKRIWYCAEFEIPEAPKKGKVASVQSQLPPYVVEFINTLSAEKRSKCLEEARVNVGWSKELLADLMAAGRSIVERVEDTMYRGWGADKKRLPKRRPQTSKHIQLSLLDLPDFVQDYAPDVASELVRSPLPALHEPANGFVQSVASLVSSDTNTDIEKSVSRSVVESEPAKDRPTDPPSPILAKAETQNADAEQVRAAILAELHHRMPHEMPTTKMCGRIALRLRGVPLERLSLALRRRKWRPDDTMGLCENIAAEVADAWTHEQKEHAARNAALETRIADALLPEPTAEETRARKVKYMHELEAVVHNKNAGDVDRQRADAILRPLRRELGLDEKTKGATH